MRPSTMAATPLLSGLYFKTNGHVPHSLPPSKDSPEPQRQPPHQAKEAVPATVEAAPQQGSPGAAQPCAGRGPPSRPSRRSPHARRAASRAPTSIRKSPVLSPACHATPPSSTDSRYCRAGKAGVGVNSSMGVSAAETRGPGHQPAPRPARRPRDLGRAGSLCAHWEGGSPPTLLGAGLELSSLACTSPVCGTNCTRAPPPCFRASPPEPQKSVLCGTCLHACHFL